MLNLDLHKLEHQKIVVLVVLIFSSVIAPFWYMFQYHPLIFKNNSITTLLLISAGSGFPLVVFNLLMKHVVKDLEPEDELAEIGEAAVWASLVLYSPGILTFFMHVSSGLALVLSSGIQLLILCLHGLLKS